ncbi:MAG: hypothetical protein HWE24_07345 [Oceanospirillaceae bacterium]|nr:hypothetical protein [Oceanospirillaceae bacterium]
MKEFKFTEESAKKAAEAEMRSRLPLILTSGFAGLLLAFRFTPQVQSLSNAVLAIIAVSTLGVLVFSIWIGMKRRAKAFMTQVYTVDETSIERKSASSQSVKIDFDKLESIQTGKNGLTLKSKLHKMVVPSELDGFGELSKIINDK